MDDDSEATSAKFVSQVRSVYNIFRLEVVAIRLLSQEKYIRHSVKLGSGLHHGEF
jgi:hypothetical protein